MIAVIAIESPVGCNLLISVNGNIFALAIAEQQHITVVVFRLKVYLKVYTTSMVGKAH